MRPRVRVEEEVGRGEAVGAVWALTGGIHDTTALCVRDSELVRMSKVRAAQPLLGGIYWMIACLAMLLLCSRQVCTIADAPFHMRKIPGKRSSSRSGSNMFHDPFGNHIPCPLLYSTITTCICVPLSHPSPSPPPPPPPAPHLKSPLPPDTFPAPPPPPPAPPFSNEGNHAVPCTSRSSCDDMVQIAHAR